MTATCTPLASRESREPEGEMEMALRAKVGRQRGATATDPQSTRRQCRVYTSVLFETGN